jgi:hypothetical protein
VTTLLSFVKEKLTTPEAVVAHGATGQVSTVIHDVATVLKDEFDGKVPLGSVAELEPLKLVPNVVSLLSTHIYGIPDLVVGLHARKIVTALDMVDWEESGTAKKSEVKMKDIQASHVQKSLLTWVPPGHKSSFHDLMESLGPVLSDRSSGAWGKLKGCVEGNFKGKDKQELIYIIETVYAFYVATSGGTGTRRSRATSRETDPS